MFRIISGILVLSSQSPLGPAPTAMGWGEELLDRAAIHRLHGPGRSYIILTGPGDAGPTARAPAELHCLHGTGRRRTARARAELHWAGRRSAARVREVLHCPHGPGYAEPTARERD